VGVCMEPRGRWIEKFGNHWYIGYFSTLGHLVKISSTFMGSNCSSRDNKTPSLNPGLVRQSNSVHLVKHNFYKINFNIILEYVGCLSWYHCFNSYRKGKFLSSLQCPDYLCAPFSPLYFSLINRGVKRLEPASNHFSSFIRSTAHF
jgi:hypothetical protein